MKFNTGQVVVTVGVHFRIQSDSLFARFVQLSLSRHMAGDWGCVPDEDRVDNETALESGDRLMSVYIFEEQSTKIWIITEGDRSATTVLFPHEY